MRSALWLIRSVMARASPALRTYSNSLAKKARTRSFVPVCFLSHHLDIYKLVLAFLRAVQNLPAADLLCQFLLAPAFGGRQQVALPLR